MGLTPPDRDLANLRAASRLDGTLEVVASLASSGMSRMLGLLVNGMTVYGFATSERALCEQLDEENAQMAARNREQDPENWSDEAIEKLTGKWVDSFEDHEREYRELVERTSADRKAMSEDDERMEIRHSAVTLTLADATVFPPGSPQFKVPVLSIRLSEVAGWWVVPTNPADGSASFTHPSIG